MTLVLLLAGWAAGTVLLWRWPVVRPETPTSPRRVTVIVPAHDEAARLPRLLESLADQCDDVIVVDDNSTDGTADAARSRGVTVVAATPPPVGWLGKTWACRTGVAAASGEQLVFLDADVWLAPGALSAVVAAHERLAPTGLLSVQPFHETERWFEQASAVPNIVAAMARGVAYGPCMVTTPESLAAAGGFEAIAGEVVEDLALGRAYRAAGRAVAGLGGGDAIRFRMYDSPRSLADGWTKNLLGGARGASSLTTVATGAWVASALAAVVHPLAYAAFAVQFAWMLRRLGRFRAWTWLLYPLPLGAFVLLFGCSATRRGVRWKGRVVRA